MLVHPQRRPSLVLILVLLVLLPPLLLLALACLPRTAHAAPGDDFPAFAPLRAHLATGTGQESVTDIAVQPDGRIVAAILDDAEVDRRVIRVLADGRLDPSFGDGGAWHLPRAAATYVRAIDLQPDGRILFAGEDATRPAIVVGRLTSDGRLDPSFGGGDGMHVAATAAGSAPLVEEVRAATDGRVVVAGVLSVPPKADELFVGRLLADGRDDPAFRGEPFTTFGSPFNGEDDAFGGLAVMPSGDLVVGDARMLGGPIIWRVGGDGAYFVAANVDLPGDLDVPLDIVPTDAAHVMVLTGSGGMPYTTALAYLDVAATPKVVPAGTSDGVVRPFPPGFRGHALARQADGRWLVAGVDVSGGGTLRAIARTNANGALDTGFGSGGVRSLPGETTEDFYLDAHSIATGPDGSIASGWNVLDGQGVRMSAIDRVVGRIARVRTSVTASEPAAVVERTTAFTIGVTNDGPDGSGGGSVSFELDPQVRVMSVTGTGCTANARGGRCSFASLAPGASTQVVVRLRASAPATAGLTATARAATFDDEQGDDVAAAQATFSPEPPRAAAAPASGSGTRGGSAAVRPRLLLRRIARVDGRVLAGCGALLRPCVLARASARSVAAAPAFVRMTLRPAPTTTRRQSVVLVMQQRVGKRWVTRHRPRVPLGTSGITDARLPTQWRTSASLWRLRVEPAVAGARQPLPSSWLHWRIR